ncbi:MAG: hypothetical protein U0802_15765 [Candidatus Binatia bacterium]
MTIIAIAKAAPRSCRDSSTSSDSSRVKLRGLAALGPTTERLEADDAGDNHHGRRNRPRMLNGAFGPDIARPHRLRLLKPKLIKDDGRGGQRDPDEIDLRTRQRRHGLELASRAAAWRR